MSELSKIILGTGNYYEVKSGNKVSISRDKGRSAQFHGPAYTQLAPLKETFKTYKKGYKELLELKDDLTKYNELRRKIEDEYIKEYYETRLKPLDIEKLLLTLLNEFGNNIIPLCYEPVNSFCHRRVLADYLQINTGIYIPEITIDEYGNINELEPIRYTDRLLKIMK